MEILAKYSIFAVWQQMPGHELSFGLLAQLVEQRTLNPLVDSSNLSGPTKSKATSRKLKVAFFFQRHSSSDLVLHSASLGLTLQRTRLITLRPRLS